MERAASAITGSDRAPGGTAAIASNRQADQCRISECRFDAAGKHHDARTPDCCHSQTAGCDRTGGGPASARDGGQEAAGRTEACTGDRSSAGSDRAGRVGSCHRCRTCGFERMMVSKIRVDR